MCAFIGKGIIKRSNSLFFLLIESPQKMEKQKKKKEKKRT